MCPPPAPVHVEYTPVHGGPAQIYLQYLAGQGTTRLRFDAAGMGFVLFPIFLFFFPPFSFFFFSTSSFYFFFFLHVCSLVIYYLRPYPMFVLLYLKLKRPVEETAFQDKVMYNIRLRATRRVQRRQFSSLFCTSTLSLQACRPPNTMATEWHC